MSVSKKVEAGTGSGQGLRAAIQSSRYSSSVQETAVSTNPSQSRTVDSSYFNGDSTTTASAAYEDIDILPNPHGSYYPYQGQLHRSSFGSESNRDYVTASRHFRIAQPGEAIYGMAQFEGVPPLTVREGIDLLVSLPVCFKFVANLSFGHRSFQPGRRLSLFASNAYNAQHRAHR